MNARNVRTTAITAIAVTIVGLVSVKVLLTPRPESVRADEPPEVLRLRGAIRDFLASHPDFDITDSSVMGHYVRNVDTGLGLDRRPVYLGTGIAVTAQWRDKSDHEIMPYVPASDPGLPGGHFDVDVFDEASSHQIYHKHRYDDAYDVTYVDLVHDDRLLLYHVLSPDYPHPLHLVFLNPHHGSGTYTFEANGELQTGHARDGFEATFDLATLTQLRVDFAWLLELRGTDPGSVHSDVENRDDSFAIRMYDTVTGALVYELPVYHHGQEGGLELPSSADGEDSCGGSIHDTIGTFGDPGPGAVTSADTFGQWYHDVMGTNLSRPYTISLYRNTDGIYELITDDFHPIDNNLLGNEGREHNDFFTYTIAATFTYHACTGQFFEFEGSDDAWVFIDDQLAMDIGGVSTPAGQYVALDRLGLTDGQTYPLTFFYAQRRSSMDSVFKMRTNIPLVTAGPVPVSGQYD